MGRVLRGMFVALLVVAVGAPTTAVADTESDEATSSAARVAPTVTVPVATVANPLYGGANGIVEIRVGRSAPVPVIVDTGFTGLVLFSGAWSQRPVGVSVSDEKAGTTLSDGTRISGLLGKATISVSGVTSVAPVPFVYTTSTSRFVNVGRSMGARGLLGIGTAGSSTMTNPLQSLPGELGVRWSLHFDAPGSRLGHGALVLGAPAPTSPTMVFPLQPKGQDTNGANLWDDHAADGCWRIGTSPERCVATTFDAAFTVMRTVGIGHGAERDADGILRPGTRVSLAAPGSAFTGWSFAAGRTASRNLVKANPVGNPHVNTGNAVFFDFTVTYNVVTGRIYLSHPARKAS